MEERAARGRGQPGETVATDLYIGREGRRELRLRSFEHRYFELEHVDRHAGRLRGRTEGREFDELRFGHQAFRDEDERLGTFDLAQAGDQALQRVERQPRVGARELGHRAALLLDLHGAGIAHALGFG